MMTLNLEDERMAQIEKEGRAEQQEPVVMTEFANGMTVRELKEAIKNWPDVNEYTGEDCEVWIGSNNTSNQCRLIVPLNMQINDGKVSADVLLEP